MLSAAFDRMRNFWQRERGAITVEFVVTLPILLAVLTFVQQYGEVMRIRNAMDIGVRDAARFLSRAPVDDVTGGVPESFLCRAEAIVTDRLEIFGATTSSAPVEGISEVGCSGFYIDDATGDLAVREDGSIIADSVFFIVAPEVVAVAAVYEVNLTFARWFAKTRTSVEWSIDGAGQESATFTARTDLPQNEEDLDQGMLLYVAEIWPRTE